MIDRILRSNIEGVLIFLYRQTFLTLIKLIEKNINTYNFKSAALFSNFTLFSRTGIFGTCVPYKQNCYTSISFTLKYHMIPLPSTPPSPERPCRLALETCFSRTSRAPTPEKTATSSRLPHDFSSGQSYHGIRMQVIRPVLHNLPCYLHRTYQVLCFNNYTPSKLPLCFVHKL